MKHFLHRNHDVTKYHEKADSLVIGSRIREPDKKNAEYYVGDYQKKLAMLQYFQIKNAPLWMDLKKCQGFPNPQF